MSFFKDLKEDIAQSVNELTETFDENDGEDIAVEDFAADIPLGDDDGIEEPAMMFTKPAEEPEIPDFDSEELQIPESVPVETLEIPEPIADDAPSVVPDYTEEPVAGMAFEESAVTDMPAMEPEPVEMPSIEPEIMEAPVIEEPVMEPVVNNTVMEDVSMSNDNMEDIEMSTDEVTVITKGTTINGGIKSDTSLVVKGTIEGDVECAGKLTITGKVAGNTNASEIYVNTPRLEGDLNSKGIVKIDVGTVVIGGISSTSVVVAGAVKGNIEVNGPVIIDSTAVVKGDVKAKSIQINSGAVIDGHCSLSYADVDLDTFFE